MPRDHTPEELEALMRRLADHIQDSAMEWMRANAGADTLYMQDAGAVVAGAFKYNLVGIEASMQFVMSRAGVPN